MCGIFGYVGKLLPDEERLRNALDLLAHRGPDQSGVYIDNDVAPKLFLGHRRLSILDLSEAGRQPFVTPDEKVAISVNGEIYNYRDLKSELINKGAQFHSDSDSEVLLWGFYFEGETFFQKIRGMYAAAIWDKRNDTPRLILLRDRQGIKPLHYSWIGGDIAFASELKSLTCLPGFTQKIDTFALDHYLTLGYIPSPLTIYENTFKVCPGEYAVFENGKIRRETYWQITCPKEKYKGSFDDAVEELDHLLNQAVKEQLVSDVPLGAFLSGGIDSSLICAIAQKQLGSKRLKTFTIGFNTAKEDESKYAGEIANYLGTEHTCRMMTAEDLFAILPLMKNMYDEPYSDNSALPTYLLSRIAKEQVTAVLSGDGGDELFYGYSNMKHLFPFAALDKICPRFLRKSSMCMLHSLLGNTKIGLIGKALSYDRFDEAYLIRSGIFHRLYFDQLTGREFDITHSRLRDIYTKLNKSVPNKYFSAFLEQAIYMPDDVCCKVDRASMACALEVRPPILDHRIVEFANSLPHAYKYDKRQGSKLVLKKVLERYVPRQLWDRPKQGFSPPARNWLKAELRGDLCVMLAPEHIKQEGFLRPEFIQKRLKDHLAGIKDNNNFLWVIYCWEKWLENRSVDLENI